MKVSEIDEDIADIVEYLNDNGFRPYSSCDGVLAHHDEDNKPTYAYLAFLKSDRIIDVLAAFLRDKDNFFVSLSSSTHMHPYELYGNMISGNTYQVYFDNLQGQLTEYFKKIIKGVVDEKIAISDDEKEGLVRLDECLRKDEDSELSFIVELNREYQPYTGKSGKTHMLTITTKEGLSYSRNMQELAQIISKQFGITLKKEEFGESFDDVDEFIVPQIDKCSLHYCFNDDDLKKVIEIIEAARAKEKSLGTMEINEPDDYDDYSVE